MLRLTLNASFAVAVLASVTSANAASLKLTTAGINDGFTLTTFLSGYSAQYGPLAQGIAPNGNVITGSLLHNDIYVFSDIDGQTLADALIANPYTCTTGNCNYAMTTAGGQVYGAQAAGCSPISTAIKNNTDTVRPVSQPNTIAKSLSIGTPADGYYAIRAMQETGGTAEDCTDRDIVGGIRLLAETEGIFAETAGGVTVACAKKLIDQGHIPRDESIVLCITGHGLKTQEAIMGKCGEPRLIKPSLREFEEQIYNKDCPPTPAAAA